MEINKQEMSRKSKKRVVFSSILSDAGEVTRAIEIANAMKQYAPKEFELEIIFLSNGSRFEDKVIQNGFSIYSCKPQLAGIGFHHDFKTTDTNLIGDKKLVEELLEGEIKVLNKLRPDVVIHGFYPIAGIGRRLVNPVIPGICYLPVPLEKGLCSTTLMKDVPDMIKPLTYLPFSLRSKIFRRIPSHIKLKAPAFQQTNILEALKNKMYEALNIENLFDMLQADLTIVNDMPEFYHEDRIPENYVITGPIYANNFPTREVEEGILNMFSGHDSSIKILCTLGSSGKKEYLFEAIKAFTQGKKKKWRVVVLAPKAICSLEEAKRAAGNTENIYITDSFVPAPIVNAMADIVVCHGGQGTVQTAIASATPIVGFAMQTEQQLNLDHVVMQKAGIRLPIHRFKAAQIQRAIQTVIDNKKYKQQMEQLREKMALLDGRKAAAEEIWRFIKAR